MDEINEVRLIIDIISTPHPLTPLVVFLGPRDGFGTHQPDVTHTTPSSMDGITMV